MGIFDIIFPKKCLECGKEGRYICNNCLKKVRRGYIYQNRLSTFRYEGVIRKAITALKYKYSTEIAEELSDICLKEVKKIRNLKGVKYTLVPIPLHWHKKNIRGFNQSESIGRLLAKGMDWNFRPDILIKTLATKPQVGLVSSQRSENLKGSFQTNREFLKNGENLNVILFDDVLTTGSTLREASKVLGEIGIKGTFWLTIAS